MDTRLKKLAGGQADAIVLAAAGLERLQKTEWIRQRFPVEVLCPAPGQGALALEGRAGDPQTQAAIRPLDHAETAAAVTAERAFSPPWAADAMRPSAPTAAAPPTKNGPSPRLLPSSLASSLPEKSAARSRWCWHSCWHKLCFRNHIRNCIKTHGSSVRLPAGTEAVGEHRTSPSPASAFSSPAPRIRHPAWRRLCWQKAPQALLLPTIAIEPPESYAPLDAALATIESASWLILTSANGARSFGERMRALALPPQRLAHLRGRFIGPATAREAAEHGLKIAVVPQEHVAEALVAALRGKVVPGDRVLLVRAAAARDVVPEELSRLGINVSVVDSYRTVIPPAPWTR